MPERRICLQAGTAASPANSLDPGHRGPCAEGAGDPAFVNAGRAADQQIVVAVDPIAGGKLWEHGAVEAAVAQKMPDRAGFEPAAAVNKLSSPKGNANKVPDKSL